RAVLLSNRSGTESRPPPSSFFFRAMTTPWVDKYRPCEFDDVVGNPKTVQILRNIAHDRRGAIPNLLVCGPSGCGKTLCVDLLCKRIVRDERESRILRLGSFDERGIDDIRSTVKNFARGRVRTEHNPPIQKLVVLDEADSITPGAFQALRRIMENHSATTRFILVCNNSTKIIEPIQSRCAILRFSRVDDGSVFSRMATICDTAGIKYTSDGIQALVEVAEGDVRKAINSLFSTSSAFPRVTAKSVYRTCDTPRPATIAGIVDTLRVDPGNFPHACRRMRELCDDGYSTTDIVSTFFKSLSHMNVDDDVQRVEIAKAIGLAHARMLNGASTFLQLTAMMWTIT
ncbi:unnamed protein product, partial [Ectocarpus sp. 12 AP-2014]